MISNEERRIVAARLRDRTHFVLGKSMQKMLSDVLRLYRTDVFGKKATANWDDIALHLADLIDRPTCRDLVDHKPDPFIPSKPMTDGFFHCSECGWSGQLFENVGFGDMLGYKAMHCPCCGAEVVG